MFTYVYATDSDLHFQCSLTFSIANKSGRTQENNRAEIRLSDGAHVYRVRRGAGLGKQNVRGKQELMRGEGNGEPKIVTL